MPTTELTALTLAIVLSAGLIAGPVEALPSDQPVDTQAAPAARGRPAFLPGANSGGAAAAFGEAMDREANLQPWYIQDEACVAVTGCEACVASPGDRCLRNCYWWPC